MIFKNRRHAGDELARQLMAFQDRSDVIALGLAPGGVVVAAQVALHLHIPFNVLVVRKIGAPGNQELAIGAVAESGDPVYNDSVIHLLGVSPAEVHRRTEEERVRVKERLSLYRGTWQMPELTQKTVLLIDDGIATGASMRAAVRSLRAQKVKEIVLAVPAAAPDSLKALKQEVDQVVCLTSPAYFEAVGSFYEVFDQTSDAEIIELLNLARRNWPN